MVERVKKQREKGFHGLYYALRYRDNYFSPTVFAMAYLGMLNRKEKESLLETEIDNIIGGKYRRQDIPLFYDAVMHKHFEGERLSLDDLLEMSQGLYKTKKFINQSMIMSRESEKHHATISERTTASIKVDSRFRRHAQNPSSDITLTHMFLEKVNDTYDLGSLINFTFAGGSKHSEKIANKLNPFSKTKLAYQTWFVENLGKLVEEKFKDTDYHITKDDVIHDLDKSIMLMDEREACALTFMDYCVKNNIHAIKGLEPTGEVFMPFNFSKNLVYALEAFFMLHAGYKGRNKVIQQQKRMFKVDKFLFSKPVLSGQSKQAYQGHIFSKEVYPYGRSLPKRYIGWAVIMALIEHYYMNSTQKRRFAGYSLEFSGTRYETIALIFTRVHKQGFNDSVRILYGNKFPPFPNYKGTMSKKEIQNKRFTGIKEHPIYYWNRPKSKQSNDDTKKYERYYYEIDQKSGKPVMCWEYEIEPVIAKRAAEIFNAFNPEKYLTTGDKIRKIYFNLGHRFNKSTKMSKIFH